MPKPLDLHIISHTHWDREWYLTFQQFRFRLVALIDALLDLLARDTDFRHFHLDGQTIVLEDYLAVRPERAAELAAQIRRRRILVGPWYVQPDEFLVSGEALIRNLLIGLRQARAYGEPMRVGYLPDSFGHSAQFPQILRGFDLETFVHARGVFLSETGGTEYWWRGLDGSTVLGIFLANWYDNARRFPAEPQAAAEFLERAVKRLQEAGARDDLILMNGVDHFVAQEDLTAIRAGIQATLPAHWRLQHAALPVVTATLLRRAHRAPQELRTLSGELRDESQGTGLSATLSARVYLKQANAAVERLLETWVEPFETWAARLGNPYDRGFLHTAWKLLLQNHAHDSICGCSIDQVHREMMPRFAQVAQIGEELLAQSLRFIANQPAVSGDVLGDDFRRPPDGCFEETRFLAFNPVPRPRSEVTIFDLDFAQRAEYGQITIVDDSGRPVACQILRRTQRNRKDLSPTDTPHETPVSRYTVAARLADVPGCGYRAYTARLSRYAPDARETEDASLARLSGPGCLENQHLRVQVAADGALIVLHKRFGLTYERLNFFRDEGDIGDQYNYYKPLADRVVETCGGGAEVRVLHAGPVWAELEVIVRPHLPVAASADREDRSTETAAVPIRSRIRLTAGSERVEITTELDNPVKDHRLRAVFPLGAPVERLLADTNFGIVERPTFIPSWAPFASRDRPHRSLVDGRAAGRGLALLSRGLYEHDLRAGDQLELTLLRGVGYMFVNLDTTAPIDAVVEGQCPGHHSFEYALLPHDGSAPLADLAEAAAHFNAPLRVVQADAADGVADGHSFLSIEPAALQLTAVKYAEERDSVIVRLYNTTDQPAAGRVRMAAGCREIYRTNLDEQRLAPLTLEPDGGLALAVKPWEIVTLEFVP